MSQLDENLSEDLLTESLNHHKLRKVSLSENEKKIRTTGSRVIHKPYGLQAVFLGGGQQGQMQPPPKKNFSWQYMKF